MDIVTTLPRSEGLTRADLDAMPDDGRRYELLDGVIVVNASPSFRHQEVLGNLYLLLRAACPPDLRVVFAPFDVVLSTTTVVVPDLVVARAADFQDRALPVPPLLAVEVLSRSTRRYDLAIKRDLHLEAGTPSYWVVDPGHGQTAPSLVAWDLVDGAYVEVGRATGTEAWMSTRPYPVTLAPAALLDI